MVHVGNARTALFNWLYVRRTEGTLVLRIEDTDAARDREEWVDGITQSFSWLGIDWDEGPYRQSANHDLHREAGAKLYEVGAAYYCDCTREQVDERTKGNSTPGYDQHCRDRGLGPDSGGALRFRVPVGRTIVHDLVRGDVEFDNATIEDFVVVRSNGIPLYILANVVDDITDRISHVVRGEEHLPNAPKQLMIWERLSAVPTPTYAHLPVIVNEKRQKLSKRRDKVALESYRDEGYLAEAMRNYLCLLGWAPKGDREIVPVQTMIDEFDFADVQKSSAFFDVVKLNHFNGEYVRALSLDEFIGRAQPFLDAASGTAWPEGGFDAEVFAAMAPLVQERVSILSEVPAMVDFLFQESVVIDQEAAKKIMGQATATQILDGVIERYATIEWNAEAIHATTLAVGEQHGLKLGKAQAPVRLAVTGKRVGPPLFESMELLGRDAVLARLRKLRDEAPISA
jgi:glutamyl-tRNA synthetase